MSLKSIEMQIALPRSQDAGKIQQHIQDQGTRFQEQTANSFRKQNDIARKQVSETETKGANKLNIAEQSKTSMSNTPISSSHPYKGTKVDISG